MFTVFSYLTFAAWRRRFDLFILGKCCRFNWWIFRWNDIYSWSSTLIRPWILFFSIGSTFVGTSSYFSIRPIRKTPGNVWRIEGQVYHIEWVSKLNELEYFEFGNKKLTMWFFVCRKLRNLTHFTLRGHELSPIKHIYLKSVNLERFEKVELLEKFVDKVNINWFLLIRILTHDCNGWHVLSNSLLRREQTHIYSILVIKNRN